jgi:hypothetical protein
MKDKKDDEDGYSSEDDSNVEDSDEDSDNIDSDKSDSENDSDNKDEQIEEFEKIDGYANYSVTTFGRIRYDKTDRILKLDKNIDGDSVIQLIQNGVITKHSVKSLVSSSKSFSKTIDEDEFKKISWSFDGLSVRRLGFLSLCDAMIRFVLKWLKGGLIIRSLNERDACRNV